MRLSDYNWRPASMFVLGYHIVLLFMLPLYFYYCSASWAMWVTSIVLYFATGMSITGGYHRFYSHQTYKAHPLVEGLLLFFGSMACQGSALRWSYEHRIHHAYVDTDRDPYSIKKGFWFAHIFWIFQHPAPIENKVVSDLMRNRLVMFQHKYYPYLMFSTNIMAFLLVGWLLNDYLGAFVVSWWLRLFALHHSTWFINSLAHTWGARTFSSEQTAVDNFVISLLTFGEGYHNYHHEFQHDYRNGVKPWQIDPTKWIIWILSRVGLVSKLRRVPTEKIVLAELAEAQRRLEATLAHPGLTEATATYIANAYHSLRQTAQHWTQRKAGQLEVTHEMLSNLRNEIRVATNALRLPSLRRRQPS